MAGKVHNARNLLLRAGRESDRPEDQAALSAAAVRLGDALPALAGAADVDSIRGHEGDAARVYFEAFPAMVRQNRDAFRLNGRTRRRRWTRRAAARTCTKLRCHASSGGRRVRPLRRKASRFCRTMAGNASK